MRVETFNMNSTAPAASNISTTTSSTPSSSSPSSQTATPQTLNKFEPYKLKQIDEYIYQADGESIKFCSLCFALRMYIVQLKHHPNDDDDDDADDDGTRYDLWLYSPIQPNPKLIEEIKKLTTTTSTTKNTSSSSSKKMNNKSKRSTIYIVYANSLHHIFAEQWIHAFQHTKNNPSSEDVNAEFDVKLAGPQQLVDKMIEMKRGDTLKFDYIIDHYESNVISTMTTDDNNSSQLQQDKVEHDNNILPWSNQIQHILLSTNGFMHEVLFYHKSSKSLILTDLIQNHTLDESAGYNSNLKFMYNIVGISRDPNGGGIPMDYKMGFHWPFATSIIDITRERLRKEVMEEWDFDKILITHGDNIYVDAREYFASFVDNL